MPAKATNPVYPMKAIEQMKDAKQNITNHYTHNEQ
jgi:hypothetical protein